MEISSKLVCKILKDKGVKKVYHANSLLTSCLFLQNNKLLSRGNVSRARLYQTPQTSDQLDRKYGIWHDIFLDTVDIHRRASRRNQYGPITFEFDVDILSKSYTGKIWVTKLNPTKWAGKKNNQRWFQDANDLRDNLIVGNFDHMIVLRHSGGELPFKQYLSKIIIDNPERTINNILDVVSHSLGAVKLARHIGGNTKIPWEVRTCNALCSCKEEYNSDDILKRMFGLRSE